MRFSITLYIKVEAWEEALHGFGNKMFISIILRSYSNEESAASSHQVKSSQCGSTTSLRQSLTESSITASEQVESWPQALRPVSGHSTIKNPLFQLQPVVGREDGTSYKTVRRTAGTNPNAI